MGQPTKSKSFILTSCLVAVSFAIINCQKAPNRNGVKPNVQTPAGTNTKVEETGKLECTPEAKKAVEEMRSVLPDATTVSSSGKEEKEKTALGEKRTKLITNAEALVKELDKLADKACLINAKLDVKASDQEKKKNNISMTETKDLLEKAKKLQLEDKGEVAGGGAASGGATGTAAEEQRKKEEKDRKEKNDTAIAYLKSNLQLASDEIKDMSSENEKTNFKKFLVDGDIKSEKLLEIANAGKSVVCALSGDKIDKKVSKSVIMTFASTEYSSISGQDAVDGFKGDAVVVNLTRVNDKSEKAMVDNSSVTAINLKLTCLNLKASAMNITLLKKALGITGANGSDGKHIKEIKKEALKELITRNEVNTTAAINADKAQQQQQGQQQQGQQQQGQQQQGQGGAAPVAADDKKSLVAAVIAVRKEVDAQKAKITDLDTRQKAAIAEVNAANEALVAKKVSGAEFTALANRLSGLATEVEKALAAQTEAEKGSDAAAKKAAGDKVTATKQALSAAETEALTKVKEAGTVKAFMDMQIRYSKANANQASLVADLAKAKEALPALEAKLADAITKAKAKNATQDEIDGKVEVK